MIDLLKKLNIRSLINFYDSPIDSYDELDNGLYAESLTEYGCWCLPQDGFHIDCCYLTFSNRDQPQSINKKLMSAKYVRNWPPNGWAWPSLLWISNMPDLFAIWSVQEWGEFQTAACGLYIIYIDLRKYFTNGIKLTMRTRSKFIAVICVKHAKIIFAHAKSRWQRNWSNWNLRSTLVSLPFMWVLI